MAIVPIAAISCNLDASISSKKSQNGQSANGQQAYPSPSKPETNTNASANGSTSGSTSGSGSKQTPPPPAANPETPKPIAKKTSLAKNEVALSFDKSTKSINLALEFQSEIEASKEITLTLKKDDKTLTKVIQSAKSKTQNFNFNRSELDEGNYKLEKVEIKDYEAISPSNLTFELKYSYEDLYTNEEVINLFGQVFKGINLTGENISNFLKSADKHSSFFSWNRDILIKELSKVQDKQQLVTDFENLSSLIKTDEQWLKVRGMLLKHFTLEKFSDEELKKILTEAFQIIKSKSPNTNFKELANKTKEQVGAQNNLDENTNKNNFLYGVIKAFIDTSVIASNKEVEEKIKQIFDLSNTSQSDMTRLRNLWENVNNTLYGAKK
ncbi:hypothetical protein [Mycoplasmopsis pulmonis]|uniref:hypothetical protein n=1 Tax=Mycoplasmopsis pulmonis TaxID=2107 RepID=UPI002ACD9FDF|nr:hypothetical protein [Mycoplasmopsis pulmonis]MDZ7293731.1 hypothetical protein [Mycoplasmopsis pulmonis]